MVKRILLGALTIVFAGALFALNLPTTWAIGISPSPVILNDLPQNVIVEQEFTLSRGNPSDDEVAAITASGSGEAAVILPSEPIPLPQGERLTLFTVRIDTGKLPLGTHDARIQATPSPKTLESVSFTGSRLVAAIATHIQFTITDKQVNDFRVLYASIKDLEANQPLLLRFGLENSGTTPIRPSKIEVALREEGGKDSVFSQTIEELEGVPIREKKDYDIPLTATLPLGKYEGTVTFYKNNEALPAHKVAFRVVPEGTFLRIGELLEFKIQKNEYERGETITFEGGFRNTGQAKVLASLEVELLRGGKLFETVTSEKLEVEPESDQVFSILYRPTKGGQFDARGRILYEDKRSSEQTVSFTVKELPWFIIFAAIIIAILVLALILWYTNKRRGIRSTQPISQETPQPPSQTT